MFAFYVLIQVAWRDFKQFKEQWPTGIQCSRVYRFFIYGKRDDFSNIHSQNNLIFNYQILDRIIVISQFIEHKEISKSNFFAYIAMYFYGKT